jgi:hypothetical protein
MAYGRTSIPAPTPTDTVDAQIRRLKARLNRVAEEVEEEIARLESRRELLNYFGVDNDYKVGTVIRFDKRFMEEGKEYSYTAIKCPTGWYTSGPKSPRPYSWAKLVEFLSEGVDEVWIVSEYTLLGS